MSGVHLGGEPSRRAPQPGRPVSAVPEPDLHAAHVVALLALPGMGPARLDRLLTWCGTGEQAWRVVRAGDGAPVLGAAARSGISSNLVAKWRQAAAGVDPMARWQEHRDAGVEVLVKGQARYPDRLLEDPEPPQVLFGRGNLSLLGRPAVALVGTRRATPYGLDLARKWGAALASSGVVVVSGLAAGVDAAAHQGALDVGIEAFAVAPIAVVGTGLDVVYPASSRMLWRRVADSGLLLSEAPLGTEPEPWRFPARNRIIAALADVVVVVESHERGGSLSTAEEAAARDRVVLAVPGSVRSPASVGTHRLIAEGAGIAVAVDDVLTALGSRRPLPPREGTNRSGQARLDRDGDRHRAVDAQEQVVLDALGWEPTTLDVLVPRTGWSIEVVCTVLDRLRRRNLVTQDGLWLTQRGDSGRP